MTDHEQLPDWPAYAKALDAARQAVAKAHGLCPTGENAELIAVDETLSCEMARCDRHAWFDATDDGF